MKLANSYAALTGGVSQQPPYKRLEGQQGEQINVIPDAVKGLARRRGSVRENYIFPVGAPSAPGWTDAMTGAELAAYEADTANWTSHHVQLAGKEYTIFARRQQATVVTAHPLPGMVIYNRTSKRFVQIDTNPADSAMTALALYGISALTTVGKYLYLAGNVPTVSGNTTAIWNTATNLQRAVVWVRGGAYSRTYTVKVRVSGGSLLTASYTTPSSSYPGTLDTSGISFSDPDYQKQVNDTVNAYNSAVTQWLGTASAAIQPQEIAVQLAAALNTVYGASVWTAISGHVTAAPGADVKSIEATDGGDGSLVYGIADEVEDVSKLSKIHYVGKVVKIRSSNSKTAYYMKAVSSTGATSGYSEVTWVEGASEVRSLSGGLYMATPISDSNIGLASTATYLSTVVSGTHPDFVASSVGDALTSPMPYFVGKPISYLGTFQGRLLIGTDGVMSCSGTEDYLNFFPTTVLTAPASDSFEMIPTGSEGDKFKSSILYDKDLVVFGDRRQYRIDGSVPLTPTSANMAVMSSFSNAAASPPVAAGAIVMYSQQGATSGSIHYLQPTTAESTIESRPLSDQLDDYLEGRIIESLYVPGSQDKLFVRTTGKRNSIYVMHYAITQAGIASAWYRWDFSTALGPIIGLAPSPNGLLIFFMRSNPAGTFFNVADLCSLEAAVSDAPYLDSMRPYGDPGIDISNSSGPSFAAAYSAPSVRRLVGTLLPNVASLLALYPTETGYLKVGALQEASVTVTNPTVRDTNNKPITTGRLTITKKLLSFVESTGFGWLLTKRGTTTEGEFNGRVIGYPNNIIGIEPITSGDHSIPIGAETNDYTLTIKARRWYPLTITAIDWVGQWFNRVQRF